MRRTLLELISARRKPNLPIDGTHVTRIRCMPWDLDMYLGLNNGRTLTLYDLGRLGLGLRTGISKTLAANSWGLTMAGSSVRYRKRVRLFQTIEIRSRALGYDARFIYVQQSMHVGGVATSSGLMRAALTGKTGLIPPRELLERLGATDWTPELPGWVRAWIDAEATRPWPPGD